MKRMVSWMIIFAMMLSHGLGEDAVMAVQFGIDALTMEVQASEADFEIDEDGVLTAYYGADECVVIPEGVTVIGSSVFEDHDSITEVTIPYGVREIGSGAFCDCENLADVSLPDTLEQIGDYAFAYCTNLESVTLPEDLETIGAHTFDQCPKLTGLPDLSDMIEE